MKISFTFLLSILLSFTASSQTQEPVYLSQTITNAASRGFYRYLPADYATSTKSYPVIIWIHGYGQIGQGNTTDLPKVLEWGLPKIISEGGFPSSFTVNGAEHSFIVISPQFTGWPSGVNVAGILNYVMANYRVDAERVYMMGISAGGGAIWDYASISVGNSDKVAAMVPFCGTLAPTQALAGRIAASKMPVWAFHNTHDGTVPVAYSKNWINYINTYVPAPSPAAKLTEFPVQSNNAVTAHECWSLATLPSYKLEGLNINIYEWLLQYKRRATIANVLPVARAGNDSSIVLPGLANLNGNTSTDADGMIVSYRWRKLSGPATHTFSDSTQANTTVTNLAAGTYQFELRVTDNGGATATDNITVTVYPAPAPGSLERVLIDVGAGALTLSPNAGLYWNNITDARPGVRLTNAITTQNIPSGLGVNIINRLDGTYSTSSNGMATGNTTGAVGDYPANATTDLALIHSSATNGIWRLTGLNASNVYTIKFWGSRTNTTAQRTAEIKRADETTWKSYTATGNTNYNNAAVFIISGQTSMDFNIRTRSGSDFSALGVIDISYGADEEEPTNPNIAPVANAGNNISITLPASTVTLSGTGTDADGSVTNYAWAKVAGGAASITTATSASTTVTGLAQGLYSFELTVTDNGGLTAKDTVQVTVNAAGITLLPDVNPANTVNGLDYKYYEGNWSVLPNFAALTPVKAGTVNNFDITVRNRADQMGFSFTGFVTVPADGMFTFYTTSDDGSKLLIDDVQVVDNDGLHASQERSGTIGLEAGKHAITGLFFEQGGGEEFTVSFAGPGVNKQLIPAASVFRISIASVNNPPAANAGSNINLQLPLDSALLNGCASTDPEGAALKFKWIKISGPSSFTIVNDSACQTRVRALAAGTYQFELAVTDTGNLTAKDTVSITVLPINQPWPPVYTALCTDPYKIVILGSSTAYGTGATPIDSSWARKFARYITLQNSQSTVVNLGLPGYNSYHLMPTGTTPPATRPFPVDTTHNITKALSLKPNAIIVNLPSNDIALGVPVAEVKANFEILFAKADSAKVPVWFTTTQPRNNLSPSEKQMQVELKNWILQRFGNKAVDFWTDIATPTDSIAAIYSANDNVHVNNAGHHLLFTRIVGERIWDSICLRKNAAPVAVAGSDINITGTSASVQLNGGNSYDPDGDALTYSWSIIAGTGGSFNNSNIVNPLFNTSTAGQYQIVLTVRDAQLLSGTDTLFINVTAPNVLPVANAGADRLINLPTNTTTLSGAASTDTDGNIASYKWRKITGPTMSFSNDDMVNPVATFSSFGTYNIELLVTDNRGGTAKDSILITVNGLPVANAGANISITGSAANIQLNGSASSDPEGAPLSYEWTVITGTASLTNNTSATPGFTADGEGVYAVELKVTDTYLAIAKDTVIISIATQNVLPVANAGTDRLINLPATSTQLTGSGSFDPDGTISTYKWRKLTGPAATFANDAVVNPTVSALVYGTYTFELVVTDNRAGIAKDTMQLIVNSLPVANAGSNASITLPTNSVTLNGSASSDVDGTIVSYNWVQTSSGASLSNASSAQATASFANAGTYSFELTVTDNRGAIAKATVVITVLPVPSVTAKTLRVNIFGGSNPFNNTQWNNWNVASALTSAKFNYDDGTASNVNAVLTASALIGDNGANYASAATACPPAVMRYTSANTSYRTLTFNGLSTAKTYDLEFYGARNNTGNSSIYQVGNKLDTISTDNNVNDVARFSSIVPDNNGRIVVTISRTGTWNYISGFIVKENTVASFARSAAPENAVENIAEETMVDPEKLLIQPNPVKDIISLRLPDAVRGAYQLTVVSINGKNMLQKTGVKNAVGNTESIDVSLLPKGMYLLKLSNNNKNLNTTFIKL